MLGISVVGMAISKIETVKQTENTYKYIHTWYMRNSQGHYMREVKIYQGSGIQHICP